MSKSKILVSLLLITLFVSSVCFATDDVATQEISLDQLLGETATSDQLVTTADDSQTSNWKNSDLYVIDEKVTISDVVDGNAFVMAKEVTVTGEIGGDLFVMAETVNIEGGYIYSSIFAMANEINIDGITYDLYAACSKLNLKENGLVYRDMRVAAGEVNLSGRVRRDAYITAGNLNISENAGTVIYGNLTYESDKDTYVAPEGTVAGEVKYTQEVNTSANIDKEAVAAVSIGAKIWKHVKELISALITTLIITLLAAFLAPKFVDKIASMKVGKAFASLGIGIIAPFVLGLVCVLLIALAIILQVGSLAIAVSGTAVCAFIALSIIATAVTSVYFGKLFSKLAKKEGKGFFILFSLLSAFALWVIGLIPLLGGLVGILAWAFGVGSIILNILPAKKAKAE